MKIKYHRFLLTFPSILRVNCKIVGDDILLSISIIQNKIIIIIWRQLDFAFHVTRLLWKTIHMKYQILVCLKTTYIYK